MQLEELLTSFAALALGWKGLVSLVVIIGGVWLAKKGGLAANGDQARLANVILGFIMAVLTGDVEEGALVGSLSSLVSALLFELFQYVSGKVKKTV